MGEPKLYVGCVVCECESERESGVGGFFLFSFVGQNFKDERESVYHQKRKRIYKKKKKYKHEKAHTKAFTLPPPSPPPARRTRGASEHSSLRQSRQGNTAHAIACDLPYK